MRLFHFERSSGRPLTQWTGADGRTHRVDPKASRTVIAPIFKTDADARFAMFYIDRGGFIPKHPATGPQLFVVVDGSGWVSGDGGERVPIKAGQAAFWEPGETHESGTDDGMKVIIVESSSFDPAKFMREITR